MPDKDVYEKVTNGNPAGAFGCKMVLLNLAMVIVNIVKIQRKKGSGQREL